MIDNLENIIVNSNSIRGVELFIDHNGEWQISSAVVKKSSQRLSIVEEIPLCTRDDFFKNSSISRGVVLVVNGKGILSKKIESTHRDSDYLLNKILPNANIDDFNVEVDRTVEAGTISIIRKELMEEIIIFFKNKGIRLLAVYVGHGVFEVLTQLIETSSMQLAHYNLTVEEKGTISLIDFSGNPVEYEFDGSSHSSESLGSIAGVFDYWMNTLEIEHINLPYLRISRSEEKYRNVFVKVGAAMLILFFITMLVNLLVFQQYSSKESNLQVVAKSYEDEMLELESLNREIDIKKDLMSSVGGFHSGSYFAFYADRIAACVPDDVSLRKLEFRPLTKNVKREARIQFETNGVSILGVSASSEKLNNWMASLRTLDFIKKVELLSYLMEGTKRGWFELKIVID